MVDALKITNEIWRKWDEAKNCPISWNVLRLKVDEWIKQGADPYKEAEILTRTPIFAEAREKISEKYRETPWINMTPEAVVEEKEIPTFTPALLGLVEDSWKNKKTNTFWEWVIYPIENGVLVGLRGVSRPHELFPKELIEKMKYSEEERKYGTIVKLFFENAETAKRAYDILKKTEIEVYGASFSPVRASYLTVDDPDAALEILASEGFDTSKILVERA